MAAKDPPQSGEPTKRIEADETRYQKVLAELKAEWDAHLRACFDAPDFGERVDAIMDACGRTKIRPKVGETAAAAQKSHSCGEENDQYTAESVILTPDAT